MGKASRHSPGRQVRKGLLELAILFSLSEQERYSREIIASLLECGVELSEGTLYPLLGRLQRLGYVSHYPSPSERGPWRKYYFLTQDGFEYAKSQWKEWQRLNEGILRLLER
jgi:PadR family transcriptional regulator PadR